MKKDISKICFKSNRTRRFPGFVGKGNKKRVQNLDIEDYPYKEKNSRKRTGISFDPGPLDRFLLSRKGKLWDDVYREVCEACDSRNWNQRRIIEYLTGDPYFPCVNFNVEEKDGEIFDSKGNLLEIWKFNKFYVHPETKTLEVLSPRKKNKNKSVLYIKINSWQQYHKVNNVWYLVDFEPYKGQFIVRDIVYDHAQSCSVDGIAPATLRKRYGSEIVPIKKQQCGKKHLKVIKKFLIG